MAKFIVLEVDNDSTVPVLLKKFSQTSSVRVVGIFARPTRWCGCPVPEGYIKGQIAMGAKYNLWVCTVCRRPRQGSHTPHNLLALEDLVLGEHPMTMRVANLSIFEVPTKNIPRH